MSKSDDSDDFSSLLDDAIADMEEMPAARPPRSQRRSPGEQQHDRPTKSGARGKSRSAGRQSASKGRRRKARKKQDTFLTPDNVEFIVAGMSMLIVLYCHIMLLLE